MKIVQAPDDVLAKKAKTVNKIDKEITNLLAEMTITLAAAKDPEGVGLAAPQVGKSLQIFIVREKPDAPLLTFINPKIERVFDPSTSSGQVKPSKKSKKNVQLEGCLSLQDIWGVVQRHDSVELSYQDEKGDKHTKQFDGFLATIIQHECDHLNGILFPKRVLEQNNPLYKSVKNAQGEIEFEELSI